MERELNVDLEVDVNMDVDMNMDMDMDMGMNIDMDEKWVDQLCCKISASVVVALLSRKKC